MTPCPYSAGHSRREFVRSILQSSAAILCASPAVKSFAAVPGLKFVRPAVSHGVMSGDVRYESAVIWGRSDSRSRMLVEWDTRESFENARRVRGPWTGLDRDYTAKTLLRDLPAGQRVFYRVRFEDERLNAGPPSHGQFVTAPRQATDVLFAWSGDTCGQGFGINAEYDGLKSYESMRKIQPDFFIHSGDNIYADGVIEREMKVGGITWRNLTTPEKSKVAETVEEFRGNYRYNLLDAHVRSFNSEVPIFTQWDDHEVMNNWYLGRSLEDDKRYRIKDINVIARHAREAFYDYMPLRKGPIYRKIPRGPLCDVFMIDERSYRARNTNNRQAERGPDTTFLGDEQLKWLKAALRSSRALWKIIASDMPIGIPVGDGKDKEGRNLYEAFANADHGRPLGRELEVAELLSFMKSHNIRNTIWLTADVHYAASHYYDPAKAKFTDFDPFWEFVSGPLHAVSLAPGGMDGTFGPQVKWTSRPRGSKSSGPYTNEQYFGTVRIDADTRAATVTHFNRVGEKLASVDIEPVLS